MSDVFRLAGDVLAITDLVALDGSITWTPPEARGFEPSSEYLVLEAAEATARPGSRRAGAAPPKALLIDAGLACHAPGIARTLKSILGERTLDVLNTRIELDSIGGVPTLLAELHVERLLTTSPIPTVDLVHLREGPSSSVVSCELSVGSNLEQVGWKRLTSLQPPIRTLGTTWLFDSHSGVLFTSDFFGAVPLPSGSVQGIVDALPENLTPPLIRRHMLQKFDWLARADPALVLRVWDAFFEQVDPAVVAPAHGCAVRGRDTVGSLIRLYRAALQSFAR